MVAEVQLTLSSVMTVISILAGCITTLIAWNIRTTMVNYDGRLDKAEKSSEKSFERIEKSLERIEKTVSRAHERLDEHIVTNNQEFISLRKEYVSETNCTKQMNSVKDSIRETA